MIIVKGTRVYKIGKPDSVGKIMAIGRDNTVKVNWGNGSPQTESLVDLIVLGNR